MSHLKWWHRPRPNGFLDYGHAAGSGTEYVDEYKRHRVKMTESFKPTVSLRKGEEKVSDVTTFRTDYIPHPVQKHEPRVGDVYQPPKTAMEGLSMYTQDFPGHKAPPTQLIKRKDARSVPNVKFEASPTYANDFKRWSIPPKMKYGPNSEYKKPEVKMENTSTFQRDFIHRYCPPRESLKPNDVAAQSGVPLESATVHNTSYIAHQLAPREQREKVKFVPPTVSMDTATTFKQDFQKKAYVPTESMKPTTTAFASKDPIASSTEFRDGYVAWPTVRPQRHEPPRYITPQGEFDHQTTQRIDFRQIRGRPATPKKPAHKKQSSAPFEGLTNYGQDFKRWCVPRTLGKPRDEGIKKTGKFDGASTTKLHFHQHPGAGPAKSCKPDNTAFMSASGLDDNTIYKSSYVPQSMRHVERYPTPDWLKTQQNMWQRQGMSSRRGSMTPVATPMGITVGA